MNKNMTSYLQSLKKNAQENSALTLVMGNEAADLDSMASAVAYAWFLTLQNSETTVLPLINIPRDDFKLRTEAVYLFDEAGISIDNLLFIDDLDPVKESGNKDIKMILIDHNTIAEPQKSLNDSVIEILDHHADDKNYPSTAKININPVGSTATIVAECFIKNQKNALDISLGSLLLGTILLDTVNLDPKAGRVTNEDSGAAKELIAIASLDQQTLFDKLQFEKFNVSSLGSYDLLRKDYKEWQMGDVKCGIGSVLQPIEDWGKKDANLLKECDRYLKERKLDVLLAMNAFTNPGFNRQIVVYIPDAALRNKTVEFLESSDLGLEKLDIEVADKSGGDFYNQKNLGISRKKLQPILNDFFK